MAKGMEAMAHSIVLMMAENHTLRKTNESLSKRRRAKKTCVRQGGALTIEVAQDTLAQKDVEAQIQAESRSRGSAQCEG